MYEQSVCSLHNWRQWSGKKSVNIKNRVTTCPALCGKTQHFQLKSRFTKIDTINWFPSAAQTLMNPHRDCLAAAPLVLFFFSCSPLLWSGAAKSAMFRCVTSFHIFYTKVLSSIGTPVQTADLHCMRNTPQVNKDNFWSRKTVL